MYERDISEDLLKILKKIAVKDKVRYEATLSKINEVLHTQDIDHYKNLRYDFKDRKRVHVDSHFVLTFKVEGNKIRFLDLQHHDDIYKRN
jgi:mRNA-degrading endonuclease RelE of RelBE toxin-antitoxin system